MNDIIDDGSIAQIKAAALPISQAAIEEIIYEEDSSEWLYNKIYQRPEWPGGASGVTVGIGYDLGYAGLDKVVTDFHGKVPEDVLKTMLSVVGITGPAAHDAMLRVHSQVLIPWNVALDVFLHTDMPLWIGTCEKILQNFNELSPDCKGALVSLAYNRGATFYRPGDRYREMRAIATDMTTKNFVDIPRQFRSMARLWPATSGVYKRRFREAALFEQGLKEMNDATA